MVKNRDKETEAFGREPPGGIAIKNDDIETPSAIQQPPGLQTKTSDRRGSLPIRQSNPNDSAILRQQRGKT